MKKKISLLLAICMCFCIGSCATSTESSSSNSNSDNSNSNNSESISVPDSSTQEQPKYLNYNLGALTAQNRAQGDISGKWSNVYAISEIPLSRTRTLVATDAINRAAETGAEYIWANVKRYNERADMALDIAQNKTMLDQMDKTYWNTALGYPLWKSKQGASDVSKGADSVLDQSTGLIDVKTLLGEDFQVQSVSAVEQSLTAQYSEGKLTLYEGDKPFVADGKPHFVTFSNGVEEKTVSFTVYTKVITKAEELNMFNVSEEIAVGEIPTFDGYYILANNIDAVNFVHKKQSSVVVDCSPTAYTGQGFIGTLDGNGHTIANLDANNGGLLGVVSTGAVVKNIAFTNVDFCYGISDAYVLGSYWHTDTTIENVYIEIWNFRQLYYRAPIGKNIADGATLKNVVTETRVIHYSDTQK